MKMSARLAALSTVGLLLAATADAQFRRGMFADSTEITIYPLDVPALLLPAGKVQLEVRNTSGASARIVERLKDLMGRQLTDNDSRLDVVEKGADLVVAVTLMDWKQSRRDSTKYVSEKRQVGTRQVRNKDGTTKIEPEYEYGRNRPSVVIDAGAGLRVEVRRGRGSAIADETVRDSFQEEHLLEASPPSRDSIEDEILDRVVRKGAGRVTPARLQTRVLLARSDEVDRLNSLAQNRRWKDWLDALGAVKPHSDRKRDSYRIHNLAVAHEAIAYEANAVEDWAARLNLANTLIRQASSQNPNEKYITESANRISSSSGRYRQLAEMYRGLGIATVTTRITGARTGDSDSSASSASAAATSTAGREAETLTEMTNDDVIDLHTSGLDDDNLIAAIKDAKTVRFDLSTDGLRVLLAAKISNRVITAMRSRSK